MNILVVEDEMLAAERLIQIIKEIEPDAEIVGKLDSVRNVVKWYNENKAADLIFLDVQLADGLCFEIFEKINIDTPVIFTTAYNEYALKAFKVNSIDYLLKPIDSNELETAIAKYKKLAFQPNKDLLHDTTVFKKVMQMIRNPYKTRFVVRVGEHIKAIQCDDILFFYSSDKSTFIRTSNIRDFGIDSSLDTLEGELDPNQFFRVNRKQLIALNAIKDIIAYSGSRLKIIIKGCEEEEIIVSREKVSDFKIWLEGK